MDFVLTEVEILVKFLFDYFKIDPEIHNSISNGGRMIGEKKRKLFHGTHHFRIFTRV